MPPFVIKFKNSVAETGMFAKATAVRLLPGQRRIHSFFPPELKINKCAWTAWMMLPIPTTAFQWQHRRFVPDAMRPGKHKQVLHRSLFCAWQYHVWLTTTYPCEPKTSLNLIVSMKMCFTCKRTYFTWANFYQSSVDAVDKCVLSTNHCKSFSQLVEFQGYWYQFISISLFAIALYSCPQPVSVPSTTRNKPWNTLEPSVNDPWNTREPPGNHPWTTREAPVNHPWTTHETSVLETQKTGLETRKTDFVPWATRETPVKHPWSIREAPVNDPGTLNEHALTGKWFPSFCSFPISNAVCHSTICMSLWTKFLSK